jgi:cytochrome c-type biogenesis protein
MAAPLSAESGTATRGLTLAGFYCLGLCVPFLLMAAAWERAGRANAWLRSHQLLIQRVGGVLLVVVGVMLLTGLWETVMVWLQTHLISTFRTAL